MHSWTAVQFLDALRTKAGVDTYTALLAGATSRVTADQGGVEHAKTVGLCYHHILPYQGAARVRHTHSTRSAHTR